MNRFFFVIAALFLTSCSGIDYKSYLASKNINKTNAELFEVCRGYGCSITDPISLEDAAWKNIAAPFKAVNSAQDERVAIKKAVGIFEKEVGLINGTSEDIKGTYHKLGKHQLDCVDESVNTTIYLSLLEQEDLIKFHSIGTPTVRTIFTTGRPGPHQSAIITEKTSEIEYAVDSWFHNNGHDAEIIPLKEWLWGWRP